MKQMFDLMVECGAEIAFAVGGAINTNDEIDVKNFSILYTIEVISSCAFGVKTRTTRSGDSSLNFMKLRPFKSNLFVKFILLTRSVFPRLKNILRVSYVDESWNKVFSSFIKETVRYRKDHEISRNDFLQLLINMLNRHDDDEFVMTEELVIAQCFLFLVAGYDSSSTAICTTLYELAMHPQAQSRLQHEIDAYLKTHDGKVTYEMVQSMPYLHQVFSETLRKYPTSTALSRVCAKNYQIPDTNVIIEKGTEVLIPISGLNQDPKYFPKPQQYDPDRFATGVDLPVHRDVYLPFGNGPRNCIGSRFGTFGVKLALIHLLRDFRFEPCSRTPTVIKFVRMKRISSIQHEVVLKCSKR